MELVGHTTFWVKVPLTLSNSLHPSTTSLSLSMAFGQQQQAVLKITYILLSIFTAVQPTARTEMRAPEIVRCPALPELTLVPRRISLLSGALKRRTALRMCLPLFPSCHPSRAARTQDRPFSPTLRPRTRRQRIRMLPHPNCRRRPGQTEAQRRTTAGRRPRWRRRRWRARPWWACSSPPLLSPPAPCTPRQQRPGRKEPSEGGGALGRELPVPWRWGSRDLRRSRSAASGQSPPALFTPLTHCSLRSGRSPGRRLAVFPRAGITSGSKRLAWDGSDCCTNLAARATLLAARPTLQLGAARVPESCLIPRRGGVCYSVWLGLSGKNKLRLPSSIPD